MSTNNNELPQDFNSLIEVITYFSSEQKCLDYLMAQRGDGAINCPHCDSSKIYNFSDGVRFKCGACRQQFTAKVGTIFEGSKIPMVKWFTAIYLVTSNKKGISSHQLAKDIKVTQKSAWLMLHRIRFALGQGSFETNMGGNDGGIVEVDEVLIGGLEKNKLVKKKAKNNNVNAGLVTGKTMVVGLVERGGMLRTRVMPITDRDFLQGVVNLNVIESSTVITDSHRGYVGLQQNFNHFSIKHTEVNTLLKANCVPTPLKGIGVCFKGL